jgi:hypothetical protein
MPETIPSDLAGTGVLIAAIAGLIGAMAYILKSSGPKIIEIWVNAKIRATEYERTREEAGAMAQKEFLSDILEHIAEERRADRDQRTADRDEAARQREQNQRLIEAIGQLANKISQTGDKTIILAQQTAIMADGLRDLQGDFRDMARRLEQRQNGTREARADEG